MNKIVSCFFVLLVLCVTVPAGAFAYNYISPEQVKQNLAAQSAMSLIDIQVEKEFTQHHIQGAVATYAYPVKSATDRAKLDASVAALKNNQDSAVIICPRGAGGAKRAYDYLAESGIPETRLFILSKGQAGWPFPELLVPAQ